MTGDIAGDVTDSPGIDFVSEGIRPAAWMQIQQFDYGLS